MKVLIVNKFLYPNGGSETYIFKLGEALQQHGHEVQYFGMEHEGRCVGNRVNAYLVDKICMKAHLMDSIEELDAKYGIAKNKAEFNDCIKKEREKSLQYLQNNI